MAQKPRTVICIGDIHGHIQKLNKLWSNLQAALDPSEFSSALVIFLGDYCDRGPHTKQVIDFLISLPERYPDQTHVFLAGNHDFAFAAFLGLLDGSNLEETWKMYTRYESYEKREGWYKGEGFEKMHYQGRRWGGIMEPPSDSVFGVVSNGSIYDAGSTFESYGVPHGSSDLKEAVPASHKKFLTDMVWVHEENEVYVETEEGLKKSKLIAVHAGLWKGKSLDEQLEPLRARDTSITCIQAMGARATTVLEISQELDNTIIDSGHYGEPHINGVSTINETRGGYMDMPLTAIVLPFKKTIRDIDIFPN